MFTTQDFLYYNIILSNLKVLSSSKVNNFVNMFIHSLNVRVVLSFQTGRIAITQNCDPYMDMKATSCNKFLAKKYSHATRLLAGTASKS